MHDFGLLLLISHILLIDTFESHQFSGQLMHSETDLSKGSSAEHLSSSVEIGSGLWGYTLGGERLLDQTGYTDHLFLSRGEIGIILG